MEERKRAIVDTLTALDARMKDVQANSVSVEEAIYQKLEEVLFQLHDETARKVAVLLSEDMELRRQLEFLNWSDAFVNVLEVRPSSPARRFTVSHSFCCCVHSFQPVPPRHQLLW